MKTRKEYEDIATEVVNVLADKKLSYAEAVHVLEIAQEAVQYKTIVQSTKKEGD